MSEEQKEQILNKRVQAKLKGCLISAAVELAKLDGNTLTFNWQPYITKIQCFDEKGKDIEVKEIKEND